MSHQQTGVWVKISLLKDASNLVGETVGDHCTNNDKGEEWGWARAVLLEGNLKSQDGDLRLRVEDDDSAYNRLTLPVSRSLLQRHSVRPSKLDKNKADKFAQSSEGIDAIVMANQFSRTDQEAQHESVLPPDDLITLTHLHEPALVYSLEKRFEANQIYTDTGAILLVVNPFKQLEELYSDGTMCEYFNQGQFMKINAGDKKLPPHVFATAHNAFRDMMRGLEIAGSSKASNISCDQSLLVSGESGAGKTVTTKHVMKYLASLSSRKSKLPNGITSPPQHNLNEPNEKNSKSFASNKRFSQRFSRIRSSTFGANIERKVLQSNPILEAFGNARTIRNDNSSRFGKFIELQFKKSGCLIGANIKTYLLEKVRLVHQAKGERNYHIFYIILAAADESERETYFLDDFTAEDFRMTNRSGTYDRRDKVDDSDEFDDLIICE